MKRSTVQLASVALVFSLLSCSDPAERPDVPLYSNLGSHHYGITTRVPLAQRYFDQGLKLYYAFNHAEAIRAFSEAARLDPQCAMCPWGIALSYGPNINLAMDSAAGVAAYAAVQRAQAAAGHANAKERALIQALSARYAAVPPSNRAPLDSAYAAALREVARRYPDDLEAQTLYAESLMDLSPWNYWERDGRPRTWTTELVERLEAVMAANINHPGANHFYIHAVEAVQPERAVAAAERVSTMMPGAGHLTHMPAHIYVRVGRYLDAITANEHAVHADEAYIRAERPALGAYVAGYYPHNYDFLAFAASMIGRSVQGIGATERMAEILPRELLRDPGMTFLQHHQTKHLQMLVRFGRWGDIVNAAAPPADLPHARAMWHYAHGRALVATGALEGAERDLAALRATAQDPAVAPLKMEYNQSGSVLGIAAEVLAGHIAAARGDWTAAVARLRDAALKEDALVYGEPPEWTVPVRQELGEVLLKARRPAEAERAFRDDLKRFPENGWSLHGLSRALRVQGRVTDADSVAVRFRRTWGSADIQLEGGA